MTRVLTNKQANAYANVNSSQLQSFFTPSKLFSFLAVGNLAD
jgi:hypothetical protein